MYIIEHYWTLFIINRHHNPSLDIIHHHQTSFTITTHHSPSLGIIHHWVIPEKVHPPPPTDGKLEILAGGAADGSGNPGMRGVSEAKNSSSEVFFNFNLDRYIQPLKKKTLQWEILQSFSLQCSCLICFKFTFIGPVNHEEPER